MGSSGDGKMQGVGGFWDAGNVCLALGGSYKDLCLEIFYFYLLSFQHVWLFHNKKGEKKLFPEGEKINIQENSKNVIWRD